MKKSITRFLGIVFLFGSFSNSLFAIGSRIVDQNAEATARGDAFVATADNPSAIFYNPAGITQLEGQQVSFNSYSIHLDINYTSPSGDVYETKDGFQTVPQLYYTFSPENSPVSLGLGVYSPFGLGTEYEDTASFRSMAKKAQLIFMTLNPVIAWKITDTLSIGGGPTFNYSEVDLRQGIFTVGDEFKFKGAGTGLGFNVGLLWQPHTQHSFGLRYQSATWINYSGRTAVRLKPFVALGDNTTVELPEEDANGRFYFPQFVTAGYSFRPTPKWNFEVNIDWTDWDNLNSVTLHQQTSPSIVFPFNWVSSFLYEFGATHYFDNGFHVSAGYILSENSVPESSFNPAVPDYDHHLYSLGLGQKMERFSWALAYQYLYSSDRDIENGTVANGKYEFSSHAITLSAGYKF